MGLEAEQRFWQERDEYHDLARQFDRNIEITHPKWVTGRHKGCWISGRCKWCRTRYKYYEYRGPAVRNS